MNRGMGINLGMGVGNQQAGSSFGGNSNHRNGKTSKPALALRVVFVTGIAMGLIALFNVMTTLMISQGTAARIFPITFGSS